jgi:hypothetical protein
MPSLFKAFFTAWLVLLSHVATAQSQQQAEEMYQRLRELRQAIAASQRNLNQMITGLPESENIVIDAMIESSLTANMWFLHVGELAAIYARMRDAEDQALVRSRLQLGASGALTQADRTLANLNRNVARLRSSGAIAETQALRNNIQMMQRLIQSTIPTGGS